MLNLTLAVPLASLLPKQEQAAMGTRHSTNLEASSWAEAIAEMRCRFPTLAERVLARDGSVRGGFVLVVNDEVAPRGSLPHVSQGDELALIAQIAGG
jgi:molybdopterin converting factor small subunit